MHPQNWEGGQSNILLYTWQCCDGDLFGMVFVTLSKVKSDPLTIGDKKVTLNHLVYVYIYTVHILYWLRFDSFGGEVFK